jgi:hypothetical protein
MDQHHSTTKPAPAEWVEALQRGRDDLAAGRSVPVAEVLAKVEKRIAEAETRHAKEQDTAARP